MYQAIAAVRPLALVAALASVLFAAAPAAAQEAPATQPAVEPMPAPPRTPPGRGKASGGRFVAEFLGSGLVGGVAAYGTYAASCGGELCVGGAVGGALVNISVTPLAAWGIGRVLGGRGDLGYTYIGGMLPFTATAPIAATDPGAALGVSMALMPLTSALMFELTSHAKALGPVQTVQIAPTADGARLDVGGTF